MGGERSPRHHKELARNMTDNHRSDFGASLDRENEASGDDAVKGLKRRRLSAKGDAKDGNVGGRARKAASAMRTRSKGSRAKASRASSPETDRGSPEDGNRRHRSNSSKRRLTSKYGSGDRQRKSKRALTGKRSRQRKDRESSDESGSARRNSRPRRMR